MNLAPVSPTPFGGQVAPCDDRVGTRRHHLLDRRRNGLPPLVRAPGDGSRPVGIHSFADPRRGTTRPDEQRGSTTITSAFAWETPETHECGDANRSRRRYRRNGDYRRLPTPPSPSERTRWMTIPTTDLQWNQIHAAVTNSTSGGPRRFRCLSVEKRAAHIFCRARTPRRSALTTPRSNRVRAPTPTPGKETRRSPDRRDTE